MEDSEGDGPADKKLIELQNYWNQNQGNDGMPKPSAPILEKDEDTKNLNGSNQNNRINTPIFNNNIKTQIPTESSVKDAVYCNDLNLNLTVSGSGSINNTENTPVYCNKIIMNSTVQGSGKIKIFKINKESQPNILPSINKKTENTLHHIVGSKSKKIETQSKFYNIITCNQNISGSGRIKLYIACDEIEWQGAKVLGSGVIYLDNLVIAEGQSQENTIVINGRKYDRGASIYNGNNSQIINSFNNNNNWNLFGSTSQIVGNGTTTNNYQTTPIFYFYTNNGKLRFTGFGVLLAIIVIAASSYGLGKLKKVFEKKSFF